MQNNFFFTTLSRSRCRNGPTALARFDSIEEQHVTTRSCPNSSHSVARATRTVGPAAAEHAAVAMDAGAAPAARSLRERRRESARGNLAGTLLAGRPTASSGLSTRSATAENIMDTRGRARRTADARAADGQGHPPLPMPHVHMADPRGGSDRGVGVVAFYFPGRETPWDALWQSGFMGNFYEGAPFIFSPDGFPGDRPLFTNAEAAFQACKFWPAHFTEFAALDGEGAFQLKTRLARSGHADFYGDVTYGGCGGNWHAMRAVLRAKFAAGSQMAAALLATGDAFLLEHNERVGRDHVWSDNKTGDGKNWLGALLMLRRAELTLAGRKTAVGTGTASVQVCHCDWTVLLDQVFAADGRFVRGGKQKVWQRAVVDAATSVLSKFARPGQPSGRHSDGDGDDGDGDQARPMEMEDADSDGHQLQVLGAADDATNPDGHTADWTYAHRLPDTGAPRDLDDPRCAGLRAECEGWLRRLQGGTATAAAAQESILAAARGRGLVSGKWLLGPSSPFRVSVCAARTLNVTGQSRVTLSLQ